MGKISSFHFSFKVMYKAIVISKVDNKGFIFQDFIDLCILFQSQKGVTNFQTKKPKFFYSEEKFPLETIFKPFNTNLKPNFISPIWIYFYYLPFQIGISCTFPTLISEFFEVTHFDYAQITPILWRILFWINHRNNTNNLYLGLPEIANIQNLRTFCFARIILKISPRKNHLVINTFFHNV